MMGTGALTKQRWERVTSFSETFTCYSAAMAAWAAAADDDWPAVVDPGLSLRVTDPEPGTGIFGFAYFRASLRADLGLSRVGADDAGDAVEGILAEVAASGRAIVAGDGFHLPWHVAFQRRHVPHWYVLAQDAGELVMFDAFAARNDLGVQVVARQPVAVDQLPPLLPALPDGDPVFRLREVLAFGDDASSLAWRPYQWFARAPVEHLTVPDGVDGPEALRLLARHFEAHGQDPEAYRQADDIWSVARHRAFLCRRLDEAFGRDEAVAQWLDEHGAPLAKRWGHVAPLLMQATLALGSGRPASGSVPTVLHDLAEREEAARDSFAVAAPSEAARG
jgi:hypothetical protein